MSWDDLLYQYGFGNEFESQAIDGALPQGQFSPQQVPHGLYAEQFSSMAFTVERARQRRTWFYRIRPSVMQGPRTPRHTAQLRTAPDPTSQQIPEPLRWNALPAPDGPVTFIDGLVTLASNGDADQHRGMAAHLYNANSSEARQYLAFNDGELLIIPETGELLLSTECGRLRVGPGEIAVIPMGMRFKVEFTDKLVRGYLCENYGEPLQLPERGVIGANGLANARDFAYPVAAFEDIDEACELIVKYAGSLSTFSLDHSPLDVVAWVGNSAPYKYDLARFNVINSVSFDHPDPSIFTVLSSPSMNPGVANVDFVIFPPRWMVAEHTFRPPYYHRNAMSELMGLIRGVYDAREHGFVPGGASLHNAMVPHGPEASVTKKASEAALVPTRISDSLAFMLETPYRLRPAQAALSAPWLQSGYERSWDDIPRRF
jgi:homogentisate 1,2-dioxygenase